MKKLPLLIILFVLLLVSQADTQQPLTANDLGQIQMPPQTVLGNTLPVTGPLNAVPFSALTSSINATIPTIIPPVVNGDCLKFSSPNSLADAGAPCNTGGGGGGGTVFSVGASVPTGLSVTGSPITTTGTLNFGWSGTIPNAQIPPPTVSALGGVQSVIGGTGQFMTGISTAGLPQFGVPPSGTVTSVAATVPTGLAISGSPITSNGTLGITWSGTIPAAQIPNPSASTLGGIESITCTGGQFINVISATGVPGCATPAGGGTVTTSGSPVANQCAEFTASTVITGIACGGTPTQRLATSSPITVGSTDQIININIGTGTVASTLPGYATRSGASITFKDVGGNFALHPFTITATGAETIDGVSNVVLNTNRAAITLVPANDGTTTGWSIQ